MEGYTIKQEDKREIFKALGAVGNLGFIFAVSAVVGVLLGRWIDKFLGTFPVLSLIGLILGIVAGFWSIYKQISKLK